MQSAFEDRVWLVWLVKVRILILTVLLGIELAIAQFTPVAFPLRWFVDHHSAGVCSFRRLPGAVAFVEKSADAISSAGDFRSVAGQRSGLHHRRRG